MQTLFTLQKIEYLPNGELRLATIGLVKPNIYFLKFVTGRY